MACDFWELAGYDAFAFLHRDDLVHRDLRQLIYSAAGPGDFERGDLGAMTQTEQDPGVAGLHVAAAAFHLLESRHSLGSEFERRADAVTVGLGSNQ